MVNKLLTNGCSMTWGGGFLQSFLLEKANELNVLLCECVNKGKLFKDNSIITRGEKQEGIYHGEFCSENCTYEIVRKLITYPYKLFKLLDADELIDLSKPGQSCQYVVRTTTDFFIEKINNKEDLSDYIVLLQMPNGLRFEWWNESIQQDSGVSADWQGKVIAFSEEKNIVNYFGNDIYKFYNVTNSIIQLGSFLKENKIKYYISTNGHGFINDKKDIDNLLESGLTTLDILKRRIKYIETNYNILGSRLTDSALLPRRNRTITKTFKAGHTGESIKGDGHYSSHGHTAIAHNLYRNIKE